MANVVKAKLKLKRKIRSLLTSRWDLDEPIVTIDTGELFIGMGETVDAIKITDFIQVNTLPLVGIKDKIYIKRGSNEAYFWDGNKFNNIAGKGGIVLFSNYSSLPTTGEEDFIYIVKTDEKFYPTTGSSLYVWDSLNNKYILISRAVGTNSFNKVNVDGIDIVANSLQDTFSIKAGEGISITTDIPNKEITINHITPLNATIHKEEYTFNGGIKTNLITSLGYTTTAIVGDNIYIMGGWNGSTATNTFQKYNITTDTVTSLGTIPYTGYQAQSFVYNGNIYLFGGYNGVSLKEFWMYNIETNSWIAKPQGLTLRHASFGGIIGDKFWVIGGSTGSTGISTIEYYDFTLEQWFALDSAKNMSAPRRGGSTFIFGDNIHCVSGYDATTYSQKHEVFDTINQTWSTRANISVNRYGGASASYNGLGYIFAGRQGTAYTKTLYVYNPVTDKWYLKENMVNARAFDSCERLGNTFYIIGGQTGSTTTTPVIEAYSTASGTGDITTLSMLSPATGSILNTNTGELSRNLALDSGEVWHYGAWDSNKFKVIITEKQV